MRNYTIPYIDWADNYEYVFRQLIQADKLLNQIPTFDYVKVEMIDELLETHIGWNSIDKYVILAHPKMMSVLEGKSDWAIAFRDYMPYDEENNVGEIFAINFNSLMPELKLIVHDTIKQEDMDKVITEVKVTGDAIVQLIQGIGKLELKVKKESD